MCNSLTKLLTALIVIASFLSPCVADIDKEIAAAVTDLTRKIPAKQPKSVVTIGQFSFDDVKVPSATLDAWLRGKIQEKLLEMDSCQVAVRNKKTEDEVLKEAKKTDAGLFEPGSPRLMGAMRQAEYVVDGLMTLKEPEVLVQLQLTECQSLLLKAQRELRINKEDTPDPSQPLHPQVNPAISEVLTVAKPQTEAEGLRVCVSPDRMDSPIYRDGEYVVFNVWANRPCYVQLWYTDASGKPYLIFPNEYQNDTRLEKGMTTYSLGGPEYPFRFKVVPPYGTEMVLVLASEKEPFEGFRGIRVGDKDKGLTVGSKGILVGSKGLRLPGGSSEASPLPVEEGVSTRGLLKIFDEGRKIPDSTGAKGMIGRTKGLTVTPSVKKSDSGSASFVPTRARASCVIVTRE